MKTLPSLLAVSLTGLAACSIISQGKDSLGDGASDKLGDAAGDKASEAAGDSPVADVPQVKADDDDPPHVVRALERLDEMEKNIKDRDWARYARESRDFNGTILFQDGWKGERKLGKIKKRLAALDAAAFKAFGGRVSKLIGSGKRVTKEIDADAFEAGVAALDACQTAAGTTTTGTGDAKNKLAESIKAYEKASARALKMDKAVFRYFGDSGGRHMTVDMPTKILECEAELIAADLQFGDEYEPEVAPETEAITACGSMRWLAGGIQTGGGTFAPYERVAGGAEYPQKIPCKKVKKKGKVPRTLGNAIAQWKDYYEIKDVVFETEGAPYIDENDDDLRLWRYQVVMAYSKSFKFSGNPCGGTEEKLFCEAGGSKGARAYNVMEHHLDRARVHAGKAPDRCKEHLKGAVKSWESFSSMMADMKKSKSWISGATYRTKKGAKLPEKDFVASFEEKASNADDKLTEKYCARAQSDGGEKTARAGKGKGKKRKADEERDDDED